MGLDILMATDRWRLDAWLRLAWYDHLRWHSRVNRVLLGGRLCHHHVVLCTRGWAAGLRRCTGQWLLCWLRRRHECHHALRRCIV